MSFSLTGAVHPGHAATLRLLAARDDPLGPRHLRGAAPPGDPGRGGPGEAVGPRGTQAFPGKDDICLHMSEAPSKAYFGNSRYSCCFRFQKRALGAKGVILVIMMMKINTYNRIIIVVD